MSETHLRTTSLPANLWQRDEPLRRAADLIDRLGDGLRAVSFDFFDTIVWRLTTRPVDVFTEIGTRLYAEGGMNSAILPADYETLRRHAEYKTREHQNAKDAKCEDITLDGIYDHLKNVVKDPARGAQIEQDAEGELCLLNPGMVDFIQYVRAHGLRVVIISDIYFSADHLRGILKANHLDPALFEFIFTSADAGVCKGTGNLFKVALKHMGLQPSQLLHVGDNHHADVQGARKAGVRGHHYPQASTDLRTILEREQLLLGGQVTTFSANSLRMLAARYFPEETPEGFFARTGAFVMGPLMTRFASWACKQYVAAGVKKVGAFMREGDLFAQVMQHEADAQGYDLKIKPLYVNRKATALAALGKLTAPNLIDWLERRSTLKIRDILKHFGLSAAELRHLPLSLDEKADTKERILKLAEFLFTPEIARRIEAQSAEERRKVMDYLRPWMDAGGALGVCDIGYNASAQSQLYRIFELEKNPTKLIGCFLVTGEGSAVRILEGMDVRHFLGSFGRPDHYFRTFLRSPAFIEQALVAPIGTTLGYERQADGTVVPVLDEMPFDQELLRRQKAFREGVLLFQDLWFSFRAAKPGLLDGKSDFSKRVLAELDTSFQPILARATAFPLGLELTHLGALPLDDYYFADAVKTLCGPKDRETLRQQGYGQILSSAGVHWPQGINAAENPRANSEFFSYARALIHCNPERDSDGTQADLTVVVRAQRNPALLRECLSRVRALNNPNLKIELVVGVPTGSDELTAAAREFSRQFVRFRLGEIATRDPINKFLNGATDESTAPLVMFLQEDSLLPANWDRSFLEPLRADRSIAAALPAFQSSNGSSADPSARCLLFRRTAFAEGLGLKLELSPEGAVWNLLLQLQQLKWNILACSQTVVEVRSFLKNRELLVTDTFILKELYSDYAERIAAMTNAVTAKASTPTPVDIVAAVKVDWIGSFLDFGSLSQVNREFTQALDSTGNVQLKRVSNTEIKPANVPAANRELAKNLSSKASTDAEITVRHQWPPDWSRPRQGALVVIQPWEFGALPADWVKAAAGVDEFWVPSNYVRQVYISSGVPADKVTVVPNGINATQFHTGLPPLELATKKKFRFLFVGGTISRKGPDVLLNAYLNAFTAADDVCLVIKDFGGQSVYQGQTFEKEIEAARLRPNAPEILYLTSELAPADMPRLYAACQCLVHPYRGEGFGMPVLEAMGCGLPVVVTRGGATEDFVNETAGWLVSSQRKSLGQKIGTIPLAADGWWLEPDAVDLAAKLKHIFAHPAEASARGKCGAEFAKNNFLWTHAAEIMKGRLQKIVTQPKATTVVAKGAVKIELPPVALLGHLASARNASKNKQHREAWTLACEAIQARPFHPEAWLLLSEIAFAVGAGVQGKAALDRARDLAPKWKAVQQVIKNAPRHLSKNTVEWAVLPETHSKPRLTVCLIAKNEEQFLAQCLESVRGLASQIIVVDTGSTDRTVEIAKKFAAEVHAFKWCDDFSAARNEALKFATGDWVLSLDADEELLPTHRETIVAEMQNASVIGYRLPIVDKDREQEGCSYVPRFFRNAPGLFFLGRVHEQIFSSLEVRAREWSLENTLGKSTLLHHGYVEEVVISRDKNARNLRLLHLAMQELPGEPNLVMNLGLELIRSGQLDAGLEHYREALNLMSALPAGQVVPELRETLLTQLTTHLLKAKRFSELTQLWQQPFVKTAGATASQHFMQGLAHLELKQAAEAAEQMRLCLGKRNQPSLSPVNREILKAGPQHCLALALVALDHKPAAGKAFRDALVDDPQSRPVKFDFAKFQFQNGQPIEALKLLNEIVQESPDAQLAWQLGGQIALSQPDFLEFAGNWTSEAVKQFPENHPILLQHAEALLLSQQTEMALPLWRKAHAPNSARHLAALVLCESVTSDCARQFSAADEKVVSAEFLKWYRQLIKCGANVLVGQLNGKLESLSTVLPSAGGMLSTALKQAEATMPA